MKAILGALSLLLVASTAGAATVPWAKLPRAEPNATPTHRELKNVVVEGTVVRARDEKDQVCFTDGQRRWEKTWSFSPGQAPPIIEELVVDHDKVVLVIQTISIVTNRVWVNEEKRLPLVQVAKAPTGVKVFAVRDHRDAVQFVVTDPEPPKRLKKSGVVDGRQIILDETGQFNTSACGHVRLSLSSKRRTAAATVRNTVILESTPRIHGATSDVRLRGMYAHLSVSRIGRDRDPLVSVSFGWATAEALVEAQLEEPEAEE